MSTYEDLEEIYSAKIFRQYKWYGHINRKRSEDNLLNTISSIYGNPEDIVIIIGDWNSKGQLRGNMSTPNIGLKRVISKRFNVYNLDEYRTSCLNYKTEERNTNLIITDKYGIKREIHSVLTYKLESNRYGCINRDKNAVNNMKKLVDSYLNHKIRPLRYARGYDIP